MPEEIRRESSEVVSNDDATTSRVTSSRVTTDPVTGEVLTTSEVVPPGTDAVDSYEATYTGDPYADRRLRAYKAQQTIYTVFAILEVLLGIRFVLRVLGANPAAGFAQFIYGITAPFMAPFAGLFGEPSFGASVFEWTALVAIVVYALLAWVIVRLIWLAMGDSRAAAVTRSSRVDRRVDR